MNCIYFITFGPLHYTTSLIAQHNDTLGFVILLTWQSSLLGYEVQLVFVFLFVIIACG